MEPGSILRGIAGVVGILLLVLNAFHMTFGFIRLRRALAAEPIPPRFDDALRTAWLYLGTMGFSAGALLLWLLPDLGAGAMSAWKGATAIAGLLIASGIASYVATRKHPGMLFLSVLGLALLIPLIMFRPHFH